MQQIYSVVSISNGIVVRIIEIGLIAELPEKVDGFVPATQLATIKIKNLANHFPIDAVLPLKVIEFDKENKKIVLSAIAALKEKSEEEIQNYLNAHKLEKTSIKDIREAEMGVIDSSEFPIFETPEVPSVPAQTPDSE